MQSPLSGSRSIHPLLGWGLKTGIMQMTHGTIHAIKMALAIRRHTIVLMMLGLGVAGITDIVLGGHVGWPEAISRKAIRPKGRFKRHRGAAHLISDEMQIRIATEIGLNTHGIVTLNTVEGRE